LPIMGLGYRWSIDYAGPLPPTLRGNKYVCVMVEHFSKWVELVPVPDRSSAYSATAFLDRVVTHFGAPAEVVSDRGSEFDGYFQQMLTLCLIDNCKISRFHPEANGLAERMVQTMKRALRKYCASAEHHHDWDLQLPWIAMGYRMSRQKSLQSFAPYEILFGRSPDIPFSIRAHFDADVDFDDPEVLLHAMQERAELFKHRVPAAMGNLQIAQHRDQLWYARLQGGGYMPQLRRF
jgi:Integrase core domain